MEGAQSGKARDTQQGGWPSLSVVCWCLIMQDQCWHRLISWWRHQMEKFSALLVLCAGNSPVTGEFPSQRPVTRSFDVFFDLRLNKGWVNNREAGDLRRHRAHYDVIVVLMPKRVDQQYGYRWHFYVLSRITLILFLLHHPSTNTSNFCSNYFTCFFIFIQHTPWNTYTQSAWLYCNYIIMCIINSKRINVMYLYMLCRVDLCHPE